MHTYAECYDSVMENNRITESDQLELEATPSVPVLMCANKNENDGCDDCTFKQNAPDDSVGSANAADEAVPLISIPDDNDKSELDPHDILSK